VDAVSVLGAYLRELLSCHSCALISRLSNQNIPDRVGEYNSKIIDDVVANVLLWLPCRKFQSIY